MAQSTIEADEGAQNGFFSNQDMHRLLSEVEQKFRRALNPNEEGSASEIKFFVVRALAAMRNNFVSFDRNCLFNIETIGSEFKERLVNSNPENLKGTELLAAVIFRFIQEYEVTTSRPLSDELSNGMSVIRELKLDFPAGNQIAYAQHSMLIGVLKKYLHHEEIVSIKKLPTTIARAEHINAESERLLEEREKRVKHLAAGLDKLKVGSDFVELVSGFSRMRFHKSVEKHFNFFCLLLLAIILVSPAVLKVFVYYTERKIPAIDIYTAVSICALELIFVFFFRVALHNFRSVKAQILQLDLRIALLQFIQSYVRFSRETKKQVASSDEGAVLNASGLERFEQVIFSGLVSGESDLPSTFDGLDGLAKIIEKVKGK